MGLKVAVQMDPIEGINIEGDTTFLLMEAAQARGHSLFVYTTDTLGLEDGRPFARGRDVTVQRVKGGHATLGAWRRAALEEFDVILLRQDPPFDMHYIDTTFFLEAVHPKTLVVNDPVEVRNAPEKLFVTRFPQLQPPTLISSDREAILDFRARHGDVVMKPLNGRGGSGVTRHLSDDPQLRHPAGTARRAQPRADHPAEIPAQRRQGRQAHHPDRRRAGGSHQPRAREGPDPLQPRRRRQGPAGGADGARPGICATIGPELKARGLLFVGIDVIGDWLTEINVTSPTGAVALRSFTGIDAGQILFERIEALRAGR
jgi:glutathione synthase